MINKRNTYLFNFLFASASLLFSDMLDAQSIVIDENFDDWTVVEDIINDAGDRSGLEIRELRITNDDEYLYLLIELSQEINLQDGNNIRVLIDSDNNSNTGTSFLEIGADFIYEFGNRSGIVNRFTPVDHPDVGLFSLPTVSSNIFEIAFDLAKLQNLISIDQDLRFYVQMNEIGGDIAPDSNNAYTYSLTSGSETSLKEYDFKKSNPEYIRVLSYNVLRDNIFNNDAFSSFKRILEGIDADIMCFQEIYDRNEQSLLDRLEQMQVIDNTSNWYAAKNGNDLITVSRYPISFDREVAGNSVLEIETPNGPLVIFNCHLPCCDNNQGRVEEIDALLSYLNSSLEGDSDLEIAFGTPYIFLGDMNLVGHASQLESMITGNIIDNQRFGPDPRINYGFDSMADSKPGTTAYPGSFTWQDQWSSFPPGRLDFIIYTNSVMDLVNSFTLNSLKMEDQTLNELGLQRTDTERASDHLPLICDFSYGLSSVQDQQGSTQTKIYPNPASEFVQIESEKQISSISLFDLRGAVIREVNNVNNKVFKLELNSLPKTSYVLWIGYKDGTSESNSIVLK